MPHNLPENILLQKGKKVYFASDFHLGYPNYTTSKTREHRICKWLDSISHDAQIVFLLGDLFDFWFEYKDVTPKGYLHFFSKIIELQQKGIEFRFFTGNHDLWMFDYFEQELGINVYHEPQSILINQQKFHIGHGDGLGPGDAGYKFLKKVFSNKVCQWLFGWLHPTLGYGLANGWSSGRKNAKNTVLVESFESESKEWLLTYCKEIEANKPHDFYIFGHRHLCLNLPVSPTANYINLGEWFVNEKSPFAVFDGENMKLIEEN